MPDTVLLQFLHGCFPCQCRDETPETQDAGKENGPNRRKTAGKIYLCSGLEVKACSRALSEPLILLLTQQNSR